jgi:hypothetical protein
MVRTYNGGNERKLSIITTVPHLYAYYGTDTSGGLLGCRVIADCMMKALSTDRGAITPPSESSILNDDSALIDKNGVDTVQVP